MKCILMLLMFCCSLSISAASLDKIVVFGDSLSDNGNLYEYMKHQLPLSPPYFEGRFTNGPVWVELLTGMYYPFEAFPNHGQPHLQDYAFGGSGVSEDDDDEDSLFTLRREIDSYLLVHQDRVDEHSLYVVWMGANNYLAMPDDTEAAVNEVIHGIEHSILRLVKKGAKYFLIVNLPDLGRTPASRDFDLADALSAMSSKHNAMLAEKISQLRKTYPQVQWFLFDVRQLLDEVLAFPSTYGFSNVTDTCYEEMILPSSSKSILNMVSTVRRLKINKDACDGYLFFDPVHPSGPAHSLMAERTKSLLDEAGIEFH